ncbi:asparaginase [Pseudomonas syringae]|uniref:Glutaminase-asparaginase n=1 Tax=Pseudomonas syringae pv. actinidiae TaxID=103796 RepID=A0A2V0Q5N0_PSESF|nr:asparaginase [Pseudomonas syringae]GBH07986.1 L-asparaginase/archaeal Glu-tRNAGln amidotransferase subunit D [Pseudomonas syringae pv. actinidiae]
MNFIVWSTTLNLASRLLASVSLAALLPLAISVQAAPLPEVKIFATGGTISGGSASKVDTTKYKDGQFNVDALIDALPELKDIAKVSGEQVVNVSSEDVDVPTLLKLSASINTSLADSAIAGAVVTHGTDTLEETAFFLDLTVNSSKPVVVVGSMRPATAVSADGPMNLLEAVSLASSAQAKDRGVLVALNDRIGSAAYTTKTNSTTVDTFKAIEQGYLGMFIGVQPKFYYPAVRPLHQPHFDVSKAQSLPKVVIMYGHQDQDDLFVRTAIANGVKGIVMDGTGNGDVPKRAMDAVKEAIAKGIPVIMASRTGSGLVSEKEVGIGSGFYNAQKARILLMLALNQGDSMDKIRSYFEN